MTIAPERPPQSPPAAPPPPPPGPERRRRTGSLRSTDVYAVLGAAAASLALTWLLFARLLPFSGTVGFVLVAYALFLGLYALLVSFDEDGPAVRDRIAGAVVRSLGLVLLAVLVFVVAFTLWEGREALVHLNFFTEDMSLAGPLEPLDVGGILHAVVGTLEQVGIALALTVPSGIVCAVFLNEVPGPFARLVRTIVEAMTALPSIVAGLFIYATVILALGTERSGFAASLALSVMMLPIIIRAADVVIRLVPGTLREASYAMGSSRWRTVWHVVLPTARSGLTTAVILGTARGVGETSPVLLTAGFTAELNALPTSGAQVSLPLATFELVKSPEPNMIARGFGTAAVLMLLVLLLFVLARIAGGRGPGQLTKRQERRRAEASRKDAARQAAGHRSAPGRSAPAPSRSTP
ncbi:ABC-type phosphate transporter, permease subunit [Streptomyces venezuelae]|uniref:phosphate ABC transporter permease PstA n=1 Tax=Streptomyces gardneri TaxID=66892 RepID=UPI0006BDCE44|nr:phosphate ABC transporter permease PstA [Streptomyces gardneri]ALO10628.1 ABC-type phosphate transporter, permease subunit [Streptomyces venezuelae]QPK47615.1 phosphate ABC transporter permease PstA [Streptomyces gardneri]WRK39056.1 phosphate ABC transporter permease PstA [Streptomyces venezuelae]CUM38898.1 Phosphate transport system permease protein PstA (TC 3.A.1.7.1) [Streptomyces venezuelae]